jgi:histidine ammonia-lyase
MLDGTHLTTGILSQAALPHSKVALSQKSLEKLHRVHETLLEQVKGNIIYGVNTGFGPLANRVLPPHKLIELQYNLIRSHASGAGSPLPKEFVKAAMVVRLNTLLQGNSAISPELAEHYAVCINKDIIPVVYEHGAVGTSGDLVQLAHIALGLIGEGEVYDKTGTRSARAAFRDAGLRPYKLKPKEGLALINGTAMMTAIGSIVAQHVENLLHIATQNGALALEIVRAFTDSIDPRLHNLRPHSGQKEVAAKLRTLVQGSKLLRKRSDLTLVQNDAVQELPEVIQQVYSLRCIPQILGPLHDTLKTTKKVLECEMNSVTDNPVFDPRSKEFLHGGNFHGDYVAVAMDQLKIPLTKMVMLAERRSNFFLNENVNKQFPPFLNLVEPGLTLALQGLQFVATSTTAQSQTYTYPHTVHSIPTNGDNQDLVSMGTDAALLAWRLVENAYIVLGIEAVVLAQAVDCTKAIKKLSTRGRAHYTNIRSQFRTVEEDRSLQPELQKLIKQFRSGALA